MSADAEATLNREVNNRLQQNLSDLEDEVTAKDSTIEELQAMVRDLEAQLESQLPSAPSDADTAHLEEMALAREVGCQGQESWLSRAGEAGPFPAWLRKPYLALIPSIQTHRACTSDLGATQAAGECLPAGRSTASAGGCPSELA